MQYSASSRSKTSTIQQRSLTLITVRRILWMLVALLSMALPSLSYAALPTCWFTNDAYGDQAINAPPVQIVTFNAVTLTLPNNPAAGQQDPNSPYGATASTGTIDITCNANTGSGLVPLYGTYSSANNQIYVPAPGIAYQLQRNYNTLPLYSSTWVSGPESMNGASGGVTHNFINNTTFSIFYTGTLPSNGTQIPAGTLLGTWNIASICITNPVVDSNGNLQSCGVAASNYTFMQFVSGGVTLNAQTCNISSGNLTVTLPTVTVAQLGAIGSTVGTTPIPAITFNQCQQSGLNVSVLISVPTASIYNQPSQGVILSSGSASGVGVQVLQSDGTTPLALNSPFPTGISTTADTKKVKHSYSINLFARYYHTSNPISPGSVYATATYNLSYQ